MSEAAQHQQRIRRLFPALNESELENFTRYFEVALEVTRQDLTGSEATFDIVPTPLTLNERSKSNLKDQS